SAARRDHDLVAAGQMLNDLRLIAAKRRLPFRLKQRADRLARQPLYLVIRVDTGPAEAGGEQPPERRFARAAKADQRDDQRTVLSHRRGNVVCGGAFSFALTAELPRWHA